MPLCRPRLRQSYRIFPCNALPRDEGSGSRGEEALMTIHWTYAPANHWPAFCLQGEQRWNSPTADNHPVNGRHGSTTGWARCARRATQPRPSRIGGISWDILRSGRGKVLRTEYLTCWGPGLLRLGAIMSFGGYCVSRPGLLRLGAVVG